MSTGYSLSRPLTDEVRQARAVVSARFGERGKLPKTLTVEEHAEVGLNAAWYTGWASP